MRAVSPISGVRAVDGRGTFLVRPASMASAGAVAWSGQSADRAAPPDHARMQQPMRGTAHQRNADGDAATFSSRLGDLTEQERTQLKNLKRRDHQVRTHENAHIAAGSGLVRGGPTYETQTGPDGRDYAVGGHVSIDSSPASTPEETITKAQMIRLAALAPPEPSGQDLAVAAKAARMEAQARRQIADRGGGSHRAEQVPSSRDDASMGLDLFA